MGWSPAGAEDMVDMVPVWPIVDVDVDEDPVVLDDEEVPVPMFPVEGVVEYAGVVCVPIVRPGVESIGGLDGVDSIRGDC